MDPTLNSKMNAGVYPYDYNIHIQMDFAIALFSGLKEASAAKGSKAQSPGNTVKHPLFKMVVIGQPILRPIVLPVKLFATATIDFIGFLHPQAIDSVHIPLESLRLRCAYGHARIVFPRPFPQIPCRKDWNDPSVRYAYACYAGRVSCVKLTPTLQPADY